MLFHTWVFAVFFIAVFGIFLILRNTRFYIHWLLFASYIFYGWWNPLYLLLILYSTLLDYGVGLRMAKTSRKKKWLVFSIVNNLLLLGFFKYGGFVAENLNLLFDHLGLGLTIPKPNVLLPVGISFYTFQSMSYTIDLYRGKISLEKNFFRFAAFVSLFPQLVAGPIERASHLLPQLRRKLGISTRNITEGLSLFFVGLFKKIALADFLALYVDKVYTAPDDFESAALVLATFAFAWQIYFDFSGYTDMARGVARMLGINLMLNFNNPYLALSLGDFWQRWHISLSSWFKDYLYIPLGGNRKGQFNTYKNMFLTMLISGLWHGAAWTFVIWGALHALARVATRKFERSDFYRERIPRIIKQLGVFAFVCFTWIFFRAQSFSDAMIIIRKIFSGTIKDPQFPVVAMVFCASVWLYQFIQESNKKNWLALRPVRVGGMLFILLYLAFFTTSGIKPFVYFQF